MLFVNANVLCDDFVFRKGALRTQRKQILEIGNLTPKDGEEVVDLGGKYLIPGLVETHFHGALGETAEIVTGTMLDAFARYEASQGVTSFVPGLSSMPDDVVEDFLAVSILRLFLEQNAPGSKMQGIYLEGPFISHARKGGHNPEYLQLPDARKLRRWQELSGDHIVKTVVAPELPGAEEFVKTCVELGIAAEIGHSAATYEKTLEAIGWGASLATHTFNGMNPLHHREPGVLGAVLTDSRVTCELIADFGHVCPACVKLVWLAKGDDKVNLISDSMMAAGLGDGDYGKADGRKTLVRNGLAQLENGTITGSACSVMTGVRNLVSIGIPLESAVKMASINPARTIGKDSMIGSLKPGKFADMVVLDGDLNVCAVYINGENYPLNP